MPKLISMVAGLTEKKFDKDDDGVEICFLERHVRDKGYNTALSTEVVVDRRSTAKELEKTMFCNCDLDKWQPEGDTGHTKACRIHKTVIAIATAIEQGSVISVKKELDKKDIS